jgi:hypothetical protein
MRSNPSASQVANWIPSEALFLWKATRENRKLNQDA